MNCLPKLTNTVLLAGITLLTATSSSLGQHFALPDDPEVSPGMSLGQPVSSIPRATTSNS